MIMSHEKTEEILQNLPSTSDLCGQPDCDSSADVYMAHM